MKWRSLLVLNCISIASFAASGTTDEMIASGARQLEAVMQRNEENDRWGRSEQNQYILLLDGVVESGEFMEERGKNTSRVLTAIQFATLNQQLVEFHRSHANARQVGFYVLVVNDWTLQLSKDIPTGFTLSDWSQLRAHASNDQGPNIDRMIDEVNSVPGQILQRLRAKGYNKLAYVYLYARLTATEVTKASSTQAARRRQFVSQVLQSGHEITSHEGPAPDVLSLQQLIAQGYNTHYDRVGANIRRFTETYIGGVAAENRKSEATRLGISEGPGHDLFVHLPADKTPAGSGFDEFVTLCKYLNTEADGKAYGVWFPEMDRTAVRLQDGKSLHPDVLSDWYTSNLLNVADFNRHFVKRSCREFPTLWVPVDDDLTEDIPAYYNQFSKDYHRGGRYHYSLDDLVSRHEQKLLGSLFWQAISSAEEAGKAEPVCMADGVEQYVALYGTASSLFFWMKHYFIEVAEPATIVNAVRALRKFKVFNPRSQLSADAEMSLASSRRQLESLHHQYDALDAMGRRNVDRLGSVEGVGIVGDEQGEGLLILAKQDDDYVEIARLVDGRMEPLRFMDTGTPVGDVFDGYQLVREGDELGFLRRVGDKNALLARLERFPNVKTWVESFTTSVDTRLMDNLGKLDDVDLEKLNTDIIHSRHGAGIKELLRENPDDLIEIWKRLKEDPAYSWELQKTGGSRWEKWSQREFFKDITTKGKTFEQDVCLVAFRNRSSSAYLELKNKVAADFGKNLDEYDLFSQVQLKYDGEEYFVADQVFVRWDAFGGIDDTIVIENKLSASTPLTPAQKNALHSVSFTVRNRLDKSSEFGTREALSHGNVLNFSSKRQWYKVQNGTNGNVISGIQLLSE